MALVSYSDSEDSDAENGKPVPKATIPTDATTAPVKSSFPKVVDQANPRKVRVNLPGAASTSKEPLHTEEEIEKDHPAKRARTTSAFSGFNAFLPAPKNPIKQATGGGDGASGGGLLRNRGIGLGRGVNLKTGAAPAFSREVLSEPLTVDEEKDEESFNQNHNGETTEVNEHSQVPIQEDVKPVGKPMMFRPLSVARKGPPKKKVKTEIVGVDLSSTVKQNDKIATQQVPGSTEVPAPKKKQSLFSTFDDEAATPIAPLDEETTPTSATPQVPATESDEYSTGTPGQTGGLSSALPTAAGNQTASLSALADNLGLSAAERRQLFGRHGSAQDARVSSFSLAAEYSHNNAMLESDAAAPAHNPVRAIAPGKHSLQQLLNAATNQKEALEESFASGKRNRKDAGSRYGW